MSGLLGNQNSWYEDLTGTTLHAVMAGRSSAQVAQNTLKELVHYSHGGCHGSLLVDQTRLIMLRHHGNSRNLACPDHCHIRGSKSCWDQGGNTPRIGIWTQFNAVAKYCNVTSRPRLTTTYHVQKGLELGLHIRDDIRTRNVVDGVTSDA